MITNNLIDYCNKFVEWESDWPEFPLKDGELIEWWKKWLLHSEKNQYWERLRRNLPQLYVSPKVEARLGTKYKQLVLQGATPSSDETEGGVKVPHGFEILLESHWCGSMPVIKVKKKHEFDILLQCLVHRCEPVEIEESVHSQAVSGLIHWGLIGSFGKSARCNMLILHDSPYSSVSYTAIPGMSSEEQWIHCSHLWRLEHELTHIACKSLVGEMRLNLYDELLADAMGMRASLGYFDANLFAVTLGLDCNGTAKQGARAHTYTKQLNAQEEIEAFKLILERAKELDDLLKKELHGIDDISLLKILTKNQLNKSLEICIAT